MIGEKSVTRFIRLTELNTKPMLVNIDHIVTVCTPVPNGCGGQSVVYTLLHDKALFCRETVDQIERFINPKHAPRRSNPDRHKVVAKCIEYIRAAGKPLNANALLTKLTDGGYLIEGNRPVNVLRSMLYRSRHVIHSLSNGYWPVDDAIPNPKVDQ